MVLTVSRVRKCCGAESLYAVRCRKLCANDQLIQYNATQVLLRSNEIGYVRAHIPILILGSNRRINTGGKLYMTSGTTHGVQGDY